MKQRIRRYVAASKEFFDRYERRISFAAFVSGFAFDNLTLNRVDFLLDNLIIVAYLILASIAILAFHYYKSRIFRGVYASYISIVSPYVLQFALGGLFSVFVVFYWRSSSLAASWIFLFGLLALFFGNEHFRKKYALMTFQLSILFTAIFLYAVFAIPIIFSRIGAIMFLVSGLASIAMIALVAYLLLLIIPKEFALRRTNIAKSVGALYIAFNALYFLNVIPPIPLALKEAVIAHSVERVGSKYVIRFEPAPWHSFFRGYDLRFRVVAGEDAYLYSAVFASTALETEIIHRWSKWNDATGHWDVASLVGFPIIGGRENGYRGYLRKRALAPGYWKVDVITGGGQVLGTMKMKVVGSDYALPLREITR